MPPERKAHQHLFRGEGEPIPTSCCHWGGDTLYWTPKFNEDQLEELSGAVDSTWNGWTWDKEEIKSLIRSIEPKVVFVDASS